MKSYTHIQPFLWAWLCAHVGVAVCSDQPIALMLCAWLCPQVKSLTAEKKKLEGDVSVLEKKVKDVIKGQGSRDALIDTLQSKIQELQQQIDDSHVSDALCLLLIPWA